MGSVWHRWVDVFSLSGQIGLRLADTYYILSFITMTTDQIHSLDINRMNNLGGRGLWPGEGKNEFSEDSNFCNFETIISFFHFYTFWN